MDLFDLVAKLTLDSSEYEKGISSAGDKASALSSNTGKLGKAVKTVAGVTTAIGTATVALGAGVVKATGDVASYGDAIDKNSQKMGMSSKAYQEWDAVLQHSGSSVSALKPAMKTLSAAAEKNEESFKKLGISQKDLKTLNREELFSKTIEGLQNVKDEGEKAQLANKLLGKGAVEMGALLNTSAEDTKKMKDRVNELGGVMSEDAVKASAKYQDSLQDMTTAMDGVKRGLVSNLLPGITTIMDGLTDIFAGDEDKGIGLVKTGIDNLINNLSESGGRMIEVGGRILGAISEGLINNLPRIMETAVPIVMGLVTSLINALPKMVSIGVKMISTLASSIATTIPLLVPAVLSAITQIVTVLTSPSTLSSIGSAALTILKALAKGLIAAIPLVVAQAPKIVIAIAKAIVNIGAMLLNTGKQLISKLISGISGAFGGLVSKVTSLARKIPNAIKSGIGSLMSIGSNIIGGLWNGISGAFNGVVNKVKALAGKLPKAVKKVLGIASPSKVFRYEIGKFIPMGLAKGIEDAVPMVERAMDGMSDALAMDDPMLTPQFIPEDYSAIEGGSSESTESRTITINNQFYIEGSDKSPRQIAEEVKRILIRDENNLRKAWT